MPRCGPVPTTPTPEETRYKRPWPTQFAVIFVTYIVVDITYQLSFGLAFMGRLYEQAGIRDVMSQQPNHAWTIVIFFMMIAAVLLKLGALKTDWDAAPIPQLDHPLRVAYSLGARKSP